ncbi:hypothetical protein BpHYR1_018999 [Brachionus plicatilis]|uniref:Uncharacterized protein n=1 Tax=Brachionus plicatilis TaxID=10195 RepID=A0A3M7RS08_BRAPC|nr:hypothetical protein BpHYR1_018999 [Brachionus plicatilis]
MAYHYGFLKIDTLVDTYIYNRQLEKSSHLHNSIYLDNLIRIFPCFPIRQYKAYLIPINYQFDRNETNINNLPNSLLVQSVKHKIWMDNYFGYSSLIDFIIELYICLVNKTKKNTNNSFYIRKFSVITGFKMHTDPEQFLMSFKGELGFSRYTWATKTIHGKIPSSMVSPPIILTDLINSLLFLATPQHESVNWFSTWQQ